MTGNNDNDMIKDDNKISDGFSVDELLFNNSDLDFDLEYEKELNASVTLSRFMDDANLTVSGDVWEESDQEAVEFEGFEGNGRMKFESGKVINIRNVEKGIEDDRVCCNEISCPQESKCSNDESYSPQKLNTSANANANANSEVNFLSPNKVNEVSGLISIPPTEKVARKTIEKKGQTNGNRENFRKDLDLDNEFNRVDLDSGSRLVDEDESLRKEKIEAECIPNPNVYMFDNNFPCDSDIFSFDCGPQEGNVSKDEGQVSVSKANDKDIEEEEILRFFYSNCRGFSSKRESISEIVNRLDSDIVILTETNFKGSSHPKLKNMITFFRNREVLHMGGVAIMIKNKFRDYTVRSKCGQGDNELITVRMRCFEPPIAIIAFYGSQKSVGTNTVKDNIEELFFEITECQSAGYQVVVAGDSNLQLGRDLIPGNDLSCSKAGAMFNEKIKERGMKVANNLSEDPATFVKEGLRRVLDVVLVEDLEKVLFLATDSKAEKRFTPFSIKRSKKDNKFRCTSDHNSIHWGMKIKMVKPESKVPPVWRRNRRLGKERYAICTDSMAQKLIEICEEGQDIDKVIKKMDKVINDSKFKGFGKVTLTRRKREELDEKRIWTARLDLVRKLAKEFEEQKDSIRVWKARSIAVGRGDNQKTSMKDYRTGEMLHDLEEITEMLLDFNEETMSKEIATPEVQLLRRLKEDIIEEVLEDVSDCPQYIPWAVYMKVVTKVMQQNKGVLRDFCESGEQFKVAVFVILNRIHANEENPSIFKKTYLSQIWKRKGSVDELANHRFVHGRHWTGKLYEKCLVEMVSAKQTEATPEFQMGGIPAKSTREHLLAAMLIIKSFTKMGKSVPIVLCDVKKCFDKLVLSDLIFDLAATGADKKAVKMLRQFHQDFEIMMDCDKGKVNPKSRIIPDTVGQGTNGAPGMAGNSQAKSVRKNVDIELCAKVGKIQTDHKSFVDDLMTAPGNAKKARMMGPQLSKAFDELSIKSHEDKTVIIVPGKTIFARKMREDLTSDPMMIQGNPVKIASQDLYLGMVIHQDGVKESIEATAMKRKGRAWGQVPVIKALLNHPQLLHEGWLRSAVSIIQGIIPATMLYSCEAWIDLTDTFMKMMEKNYKQMIYSILEIPQNSSYAAIMGETGLMKLKFIINKARLYFVSQVLWDMEGSEVRKLLVHDWESRGEKSHIETMRRIAKEYGVSDFTKVRLDAGLLRERIRFVNDLEIMREMWEGKAAEKKMWVSMKWKRHLKWTKLEAKARLMEAAGSMRFLSQASGWRAYYRARGVSTKCVSRMCDAEDTADHAKICKFMETKWNDKLDEDLLLKAKYYVNLHKERLRKYAYPIL